MQLHPQPLAVAGALQKARRRNPQNLRVFQMCLTEAEQGFDQGGLAGAIGADDGGMPTAAKLQIADLEAETAGADPDQFGRRRTGFLSARGCQVHPGIHSGFGQPVFVVRQQDLTVHVQSNNATWTSRLPL